MYIYIVKIPTVKLINTPINSHISPLCVCVKTIELCPPVKYDLYNPVSTAVTMI